MLSEAAAESVASSTPVKSLSFHDCVIDVLVDDGFGAVLAQGDKRIQKEEKHDEGPQSICALKDNPITKTRNVAWGFVYKMVCIPPNCCLNRDTGY